MFRDISLIELYNIYNNLLEIYNNKQNRNNVIQKKIYVDKYRIEDKLEYIMNKLKNENVNSFYEIIEKCDFVYIINHLDNYMLL